MRAGLGRSLTEVVARLALFTLLPVLLGTALVLFDRTASGPVRRAEAFLVPLFLIGVAATYRIVGTLDLAQIAERIGGADDEALILSASMIFAGLSVKLGLFPFHSWVPVLYSHARPAVAAVMTGALVNLAAYGLLRFGFGAFTGTSRSSR